MSIENTSLSKLIRIVSNDSVGASDTPSNFTVNLSRGNMQGSIKRIVVKNVDFPNYFYNITEKNNMLGFGIYIGFESTTWGHITINPGFYTASQLSAIIVTKLTTAFLSESGTATITIDPYTNIWTFAFSVNAYILNDVEYKYMFNNTRSMASTIGVLNSPVSPVPSQICDRRPDLHGVTKAYIKCPELASSNLIDSDSHGHDILAQIPVYAPYGFYNYYEAKDDELDSINYKGRGRIPDQLHFQLLDVNNNILEFPNSFGSLTVILKIYYS